MYQTHRALTKEVIENYTTTLRENEKSSATVAKYVHDLNMAAEYFAGTELTKAALIRWKETLIEKYASATVNSILAAINGFFKHMGCKCCILHQPNDRQDCLRTRAGEKEVISSAPCPSKR